MDETISNQTRMLLAQQDPGDRKHTSSSRLQSGLRRFSYIYNLARSQLSPSSPIELQAINLNYSTVQVMTRKRRQTYLSQTDDIVKFVKKKTRRGHTLAAVQLSDGPSSSPSTSRDSSRSPTKSKIASSSPLKSQSKLWDTHHGLDEWIPPPDPPSFESLHHNRRQTGKVGRYFEIHSIVHKSNSIVQSQNDYMREWLPVRDVYLEELLRMEECESSQSCTMCKVHVGDLRCIDCTDAGLLCKPCCLTRHKNLPFHHLQRWSGRFFEATSLTAEGFIMHLGHGGDPCNHHDFNLPSTSTTYAAVPNDEEQQGFDNFKSRNSSDCLDRIVVVDVLGVHTITVAWCQCVPPIDRHIQLLRAKLFPTSLKRPSSAFTFQVLDYFHIDSVECKTSAMTFYSKLRRLTDYISPERVPVCSISRLIIRPHKTLVGSISRAHESLPSVEKLKSSDAIWICP